MNVVAEALRSLRSRPAFTALVAAVAAAVCLSVQLTTGESVVAQARAQAAVDRIGARIVEVRSVQAPAVPVGAVRRIDRIEGVDWVLGLGGAFDVTATGLDRPAPAVAVVGTSPYLRFTSAAAGAFLSRTSAGRLGVDAPAGAADDIAIAGGFVARGPLVELDRFVVVIEPLRTAPIDRLVVAVASSTLVPAVAAALRATIGVDQPGAITVQAPDALLAAGRAVDREVDRFGRGLVLLVLSAGVAIVAVVTAASLAGRRRDFGRRRALGASRSQVVGLVLVQVAGPGLAGAALGTAGGVARLRQVTGSWGDGPFAAAVAVLTVLAVVVAALPPAVAAARRDPVTVLRLP